MNGIWRAFTLAMLAATAAACSSLRPDTPKSITHALDPTIDTPAARYVHRQLEAHNGLSGFRLLTKSDNALLSRVALTDEARHSIDLQYYIFNNDATGRLLAQRLLAAADRGVRVRILVDDVNLGKTETMLSALALHPNIQVRLFNPFRTRQPSFVSRVAQFVLEPRRLNRRMHNKMFIVDGWVAVIGGRNIGDEYFDDSREENFRDLDLVAIGPVVGAASNSFDRYWNCYAAFPLRALEHRRKRPDELETERVELAQHARAFAESAYAQAALDDLPHGATADRSGDWFWGNASFIADEPEKAIAGDDAASLRMAPRIRQLIDTTHGELLLISPYFVPGDSGTRYLTSLSRRGVAVKVLTNSLASTDQPAVHAGYSHYRRALLHGGVQLFELRPREGPKTTADGEIPAGVSLHAKALVVDRTSVFIGSMNMDQRSKLLNTEMGVIVDSSALAEAVADFFRRATTPEAAYSVRLGGADSSGPLVWSSSANGEIRTSASEPGATIKQRLEIILVRILPLEELL